MKEIDDWNGGKISIGDVVISKDNFGEIILTPSPVPTIVRDSRIVLYIPVSFYLISL